MNVAVRFEPAVVNAVIAATEINAANRPYSIAVAPDSSLKNVLIIVMGVILTPRVTANRRLICSDRLNTE